MNQYADLMPITKTYYLKIFVFNLDYSKVFFIKIFVVYL